MVSNIPFGSHQPEWKAYLKTYSSIFGWNFRKIDLTIYLPSGIFGIFWQMVCTLAITTETPAPGEETCWNARLFDIASKIKVLTNICSKCTVHVGREKYTNFNDKKLFKYVLIALNLQVIISGHQWAGRPQMVRILAFPTSSLLLFVYR